MKEWKTYKVGDICSSISETYKSKSKSVVLINTSDVLEGRCLNHEFVPNKDLKGQFKKVFKFGDILYSEIRPANKRFAYIDFDATDYIASTKLMVLRNNDKVTNRFLYHYLKSESTIAELQALAESRSGTFPQITFSELSQLEISIPDIETQLAISSFIDTLESKIELNRQINDNLEQQAQALYKSWFVDFEPFKDCEFVDSELGLIPEGWQVGTYEQIIQTTISGDWGKDILTGNYTHKVACVRGCDFQDMSIGVRGKTPERYILEKNYQAKRLIDNDVIVEISGGTSTISTGRVCLINADLLGKYNNDIVCTNFCKVVRPIQSYGAYLYYSWKYKYDCRVMFGYENGTSGIKNFQISDFLSKEPVIIPSEYSIKEFQMIIDTLQNNIQTNGSEIMKIESLRDSLLPKLMSGELEINEIDC